MRSMFPPVQTQHFSIDFFQVKSQEDTVKCIARLCFTPDGHLYSTPQKRCLVREWSEENGIWYMKGLGSFFVKLRGWKLNLDTSEIVKKALKQEESEYRIEIHRLKRCLEAIKKVNNWNKQTVELQYMSVQYILKSLRSTKARCWWQQRYIWWTEIWRDGLNERTLIKRLFRSLWEFKRFNFVQLLTCLLFKDNFQEISQKK